MDDFEKNIRQSYNQEWPSAFEEKDWFEFNDFRQEKKQNKYKFIVWIFLLSIGVGLAGLYISQSSQFTDIPTITSSEKTIEKTSNTHENENRNTEIQATLVTKHAPIVQKEIGEEKVNSSKEITLNIDMESEHLTDEKSQSKSQLSANNIDEGHNSQEISTSIFTESNIVEQENPKITQSEDLAAINTIQENIKRNTQGMNNLPVSLLDRREITPFINHDSRLILNTIPAVQPINTPLFKNNIHSNAIAIKASTGISFTTEQEVLDEISSFNDFSLMYFTKNRFRYYLNAHFQELTYKSRSVDPRIAIRDIDDPGDNLSFIQASAETQAMYVGIGLQYELVTRKYFTHYIGLTYGVETILRKELEYEFEDETDGEEKIIKLSNSDKKLKWHYPKMVTGLEFTYRNFIIFTELSYIHEFNEANRILPVSINGSVGVGYRF